MPYEHFLPLFLLWLFALAIVFTSAKADTFKRRPELKRHLVHGPIFYLLALPVLFGLHQTYLVHRTEQQIRSYIQSGNVNEWPEFRPHLVFWSRRCGNANEGLAYSLYGSIAESGLDSPDRDVRTRSLRATLSIYDGPYQLAFWGFEDVVRKAKTLEWDPETTERLNSYRFPGESPFEKTTSR